LLRKRIYGVEGIQMKCVTPYHGKVRNPELITF